MKYHALLQQAAAEQFKLHIVCKDGISVIGVAEQYENGYIKLRFDDGLMYISYMEIEKPFKIK
ncbi:hypothetical protein E0485_14535 [Paenibacillus albiflavus]|uniref:Uncharacterized protein n=1 Tax=Paenibacillus albiflavus TaxID=2545760 RepID=A0A4R4EAV4_9BACL|nr:hypothetical protein [Paenibacillus albiflavus]TCZ76060.1 hypothetical protein E0485_14535 [Paenibacillus albiflavus]